MNDDNCLALRKSVRKVTLLYDNTLAPAGIRLTQFSILLRLSQECAGINIKELAKQLVMDASTLGQNLKPLAREGLINISAGDDRRIRVVSLTSEGSAKFRDAKILWTQAQRVFERGFGNAASEHLRGGLHRISVTDFVGTADSTETEAAARWLILFWIFHEVPWQSEEIGIGGENCQRWSCTPRPTLLRANGRAPVSQPSCEALRSIRKSTTAALLLAPSRRN